jgi:hypothetical protein
VPAAARINGFVDAYNAVSLIGRFSDGTCRVVELDNARRSADI